MGHTPLGYRIENGIAIIDEPAAAKLRLLYKNYLSGMSLSKAAAEARIPTYHGTAKRLMGTVHYLGDSFYPAIIDKETYQKAQEERKRRATKLGRNNKQTQMKKIQIPIVSRKKKNQSSESQRTVVSVPTAMSRLPATKLR